MMKVFERVVPENKPYDRLKCRKCDLCGVMSRGEHWEAKGIYESNETIIAVEVMQKEGANYYDGGSGTKYEVDLCPTCFKEKLIPWLNSQGAEIKQEEWDW
jgi:hypothetical protein